MVNIAGINEWVVRWIRVAYIRDVSLNGNASQVLMAGFSATVSTAFFSTHGLMVEGNQTLMAPVRAER